MKDMYVPPINCSSCGKTHWTWEALIVCRDRCERERRNREFHEEINETTQTIRSLSKM